MTPDPEPPRSRSAPRRGCPRGRCAPPPRRAAARSRPDATAPAGGRGPLAEDDEAPRRRQHRHDPARREVGQPGEESDEEEERGFEHEPREGAPAREGRRDGGDPVRRGLGAGIAGPVASSSAARCCPQRLQLAAQLGGDALQLADTLAEGGECLLDAGRVVPLSRRAAARRPAAARSSPSPVLPSAPRLRTPRRRTRTIRPLRSRFRSSSRLLHLVERLLRPARGSRGGAPRATAAVPTSSSGWPSAASNSSRSSAVVACLLEPRAQLLGGIGLGRARSAPAARRRSRQSRASPSAPPSQASPRLIAADATVSALPASPSRAPFPRPLAGEAA